MAKPTKPAKYQELGLQIQSWRAEKFRSCLALFREVKFSFSYDSYVEFEKGKALPTPEQLVEIAHCFGKDRRIALLLWAKVQMPVADLASVFDGEIARLAEPSPVSPSITAGVSFETTWVLNLADRDLFLQWPWLWTLCIALSAAYPRPVELSHFPEPRLLEIIRPWLEAKNILHEGNALRLRLPHIHMPKTEEWEEVRKNNFRAAVDETQAAYRFVFHRPLTAEQRERWLVRLRSLEEEFAAEPFAMEPGEAEAAQVLAVLYGTRMVTR